MKSSIKVTAFVVSLAFSGSLYAAELPVVTSFSILGDVAKQIGGNRVNITNLVPIDGDAHAYQLTSRDLKKIGSAKLILINGLGFEKADVIRAIKQSKIPYAEATAGISPISNHAHHDHDHHHHHHHDHGEFDPHVWHDPVLMQKYAANVTTALIKADPAGKTYYQANFKKYSQDLVKLDQYARQQFNSIPAAQRKVLTGHDAFGYLGKRYNVQFIAPQGVSTESQPSAKTVAAIIRQIKQNNVKAVFTENIKDGRMIQRIAQETGVKVGGQLYSDALSNNANAKTYLDMYYHNVRSMAQAMK